MALSFDRPVALCPERGVLIFAEAAPAPLEGFDPVAGFGALPCPIQWHDETPAQRLARLEERRRKRREAGLD